MTASLLPNGQLQFLDNNGDPLASGYVYTYTPGTTGFKNSWQNSSQTTLNTNPIRLDAGGRCTLYGSGQYRLVVQDYSGNLVEDTLTSDTLAATGQLPYGVDVGGVNAISIPSLSPEISALNAGQSFLVKINHTVTGPTTLTLETFGTFNCITPDGLAFSSGDLQATVDAFFIYTGSAMQLMSPNLGLLVFNNGVASAGSASGVIGTTNPSVPSTRVTEQTSLFSILVAQGTTSHNTNTIEVGGNFGLISNTGTAGHEAVCLYSGLEAKPGCWDSYSLEASLAIDAGATAANIPNLFGLQVLFTNSDRDLPITGVNGFGTGIRLSGTPSTGCTGSFGFLMLGGALGSELFHVGIALEAHTAKDFALQELTGATTGLALYGGTTQAYKIDCSPLSATVGTSAYDMRLANAKGIVARNAANSADVPVLSLDGSNSLILGGTTVANIVPCASFAPLINDSYNLGAIGDQFHNIVGTNVYYSTLNLISDRTLKSDFAPITGAVALLMDLQPTLYHWKDKEEATSPLNSGFIAQEVGLWADRHGLRTHTQEENGIQSYKPDQMVAILWKVCQEQQGRIEALESKFGGLA